MRKLLFLLLLLGSNWVQAQTSFIDTKLSNFCFATLKRTMKEGVAEINEASCVIMSGDGKVVTTVGIGQLKGKYKEIPTINTEPIPVALTRAIHYLCLAEMVSHDYVVDASGGYYVDSVTNSFIMDENRNLGGYGLITLDRAMDCSNVGVYKALLATYKKSMRAYGAAMWRSGIFFTTDTAAVSVDSDTPWKPYELMGGHSKYTMLQQVAWLSGVVLNQGRIVCRFRDTDPVEPICTALSSKKALGALRKALVLAVDSGSAQALKTSGVEIGAVLNISEPDAIQFRTATGFACLPMNNTGGYTIGVYVRKHETAGRKMVATILRQIIDFLAEEGYVTAGKNSASYNETIKHSDNWVHPAQR